MKYAVLGGTFNPIHVGHSIMAEFVYSTGLFDGIIILPAGDPPHKDDEVINAKHRLNMCELIANRQAYIEVSDLEIKRKGRTYTIDTMEAFKKSSNHEYAMIIGGDTLMQLEQWKRAKDVLKQIDFVVIDRIDIDEATIEKQIHYLTNRYGTKFTRVSMPYIGISSTLIRDRAKSALSISHLVDRSVESYILDHELYKVKDRLARDIKNRIKKSLKKQLSDKRFEHTMGVKQVAMSLADFYGVDINQAALAGMLHDCAKYLKNEDIFKHCDKYHISLTDNERKNPQVIHAKLGALMASDEYEIYDQEVLSAIRYHTTGKPNMSRLEQIIYVADYLEPNREKASNLAKYRNLAYESLDDVTYYILKDTVEFLQRKEVEEMDPLTLEAYEYYAALYKQKNNRI